MKNRCSRMLVRRRMVSTTLSRALSSDTNVRLVRTLYRQIIRWCNVTDPAIPFCILVTLKPPYVDETSLQELASGDSFWKSLLPEKSKLEAHQSIIPVYSSHDMRNLCRVNFRMNNKHESSPEVTQERISVAFEVVKSLNKLSEQLKMRQEIRENHLDRTGVHFHVGQGKYPGQ